ncbi:MAG: transposase, partial [Gammaproteobacteria bacterium]|nr:transposase [Gammaproteobacteria bacterium]
MILFQSLFTRIGLKQKLSDCFQHLKVGPIFGYGFTVMLLIVHLLLGYRQLQDMRYYRDDPVVHRLLGVKRLPDVATISRSLAEMDTRSVEKLRRLNRRQVLQRIEDLGLTRVALDFDGSVLSTSRFAEGMAVGYNRRKKGQRSYYPLFCTIAQTGQAFDVWHRPGNVHDSNGAEAFILASIREIRAIVPRAIIEVRMDSAFFSDAIVGRLENEGVEFTISVPFERFAKLKCIVEGRKRWRHLDQRRNFFQMQWKPNSWQRKQRFVFIRTRNRKQHKEPLQLDMFIPYEYGYDFKVIVTNKPLSAKKALAFH